MIHATILVIPALFLVAFASWAFSKRRNRSRPIAPIFPEDLDIAAEAEMVNNLYLDRKISQAEWQERLRVLRLQQTRDPYMQAIERAKGSRS